MKTNQIFSKIVISIISIFITVQSFGQSNYIPHSACSNYNTFLTSPNLHLLEAVVDTVMPDGTIYFDPEKLNVTGEPDEIYSLLGLNSNTSFEYLSENVSFFDKDLVYIKYKQLYRGLEVEGGGFTASYIVVNGQTGGPGGPDNPCLNVFMLAPYLLNDIDVPIVPTVSEDQIYGILPYQKIISIELIISHNISYNCNYNLVWRVNCNENTESGSNVNVNYWIDVNNGAILKRVESQMDIQAPTETYGNQMLNEMTTNGQTRLISPDGKLRVYNFANVEPDWDLDTDEWVDNLIPTTNMPQWGNEAPGAVYQAFYVGSRVIPLFSSININFENHLNIGVFSGFGAGSLNGSTLDDAYIKIGRINSRSTALFDVIAHEIGHTYLDEVPINYSELGNTSLHEGISDIIGTYIESLQQGSIDWVGADDEPLIASVVNRDMEHPTYDCLTDPYVALPEGHHYQRGLALGHWYFLVSQGDVGLNITSLGNLLTLQILLEGVDRLSPTADIPDLMKATLNVCSERYGRCSQQFLSCQRAWEEICVSTAIFGRCNYNIVGPTQVYEEDNRLVLYASGGLPNASYCWRIIGNESCGFSAFGHPLNANTYNGGYYLELTKFPTFDYYPQLITFEVYCPNLSIPGGNPYARHLVKFIDGDGDDPTCDEFYNGSSMVFVLTKDSEIVDISLPQSPVENNKIEVYNLLGYKIYSGLESDFKHTNNGVYFIVKHDDTGKIISVNKMYKF